MKTNNSMTGLELLLVAFIVLKLCGVISWSWWWVLCPLWIPLGIVGLFLLAWGVAYLFGRGTIEITRNK